MNNKLLIKLFIASEALFFLSLMVAYVYFWQAAHFRREALDHLSITTTGTFTGLLVFSSLTFWLSERMHYRGLIRASSFFLVLTILLGCIFLVGQAHEYYKLINEDITIGKDEFGTSFFYTYWFSWPACFIRHHHAGYTMLSACQRPPA